jgi:hypothetical protein
MKYSFNIVVLDQSTEIAVIVDASGVAVSETMPADVAYNLRWSWLSQAEREAIDLELQVGEALDGENMANRELMSFY